MVSLSYFSLINSSSDSIFSVLRAFLSSPSLLPSSHCTQCPFPTPNMLRSVPFPLCEDLNLQ